MTSTRRWPAEWERHSATWLAWPHNSATWPGCLPEVLDCFSHLAGALAEVETVHVLAAREFVDPQSLPTHKNIRLHNVRTHDAWIRDYGPTFVELSDGRLSSISWKFNGWGEKYGSFEEDQLAGEIICKLAEPDGSRRMHEVVLEGGAIDTNGEGIVLTTVSCVQHANRNPQLDQNAIDSILTSHLAASEVVWLPGCDLTGDDTDGHVDQLARFVNRNTIVVASCDDDAHPDYRQLCQHVQQVRQLAAGRWQIVELPVPHLRYRGSTLPASYCNFYLANELVVVPTFGTKRYDDQALSILGDLLPARQMIPIDARHLLVGYGAIHCVTLHQPGSQNGA